MYHTKINQKITRETKTTTKSPRIIQGKKRLDVDVKVRFTDEDVNYVYDKNNGYCYYCKKKLSFVNYGKHGKRGAWHIDHSKARANGGSDYRRNLVPACIGCNLDKSTLSRSYYKRKFQPKTFGGKFNDFFGFSLGTFGSINQNDSMDFMKFQELTDNQWSMIEPYIPKPAKTGRPRCDDRITINGIVFVLVTGCRWDELPKRYGSKSTAHLRFQNLQQKGMWKKILTSAIKSAHKQNNLSLQKISVDSSSIAAKKGETR